MNATATIYSSKRLNPWLFFALALGLSWLFWMWIYNNANRSTLSAALLHFMVNVSGELFELTARARFYQALLIVVVTAAITIVWGPKTLTRREGAAPSGSPQGAPSPADAGPETRPRTAGLIEGHRSARP